MRILMVNKFYPPYIGGVETVAAQFAVAAHKAGIKVEVLACQSKPGLSSEKSSWDDIPVTRCNMLGMASSMPLSPAFLPRYLSAFKAYDLIHFHEPFPLGTLAALLTGTRRPYVITWHSDIVGQRLLRRLVVPLQRRACRSAVAITTTSDALAGRSPVLKEFPSKVRVIPLSVEVGERSNPAPPHPPSPVLPPYFLFFGRLASYKGLDVLVQALRKVRFRNARLIIAGDGVERHWLEQNVLPFGDSVSIINRPLSAAEKRGLMANCEFLVFPSVGENEAFGIVQLEAMAQGKPVINTRLPTGVPWVSKHLETGLTVEPRDAEGLANAINLLLDDTELRAKLGRQARLRVESHFSDERVLPAVLRVYEDAMRQRIRCRTV